MAANIDPLLTSVTAEEAEAIGRALYTVASSAGTEPLSAADRTAITSALRTVFASSDAIDVDALTSVASVDLVRVVMDPTVRLDLVRALAVIALLDGVVEQAKLELVLDFASALHVHAEFVDAVDQLSRNHVRWVGYDMIRANVATIPGVPWVPDDPYGPFLPYHGEAVDPSLHARYERLGNLPKGSFGHAFYEHYTTNRYAFPGVEHSLVEAWATPHDSLHVLSGYSTSAQGELLVAAFTGGMLDPHFDLMETHVLPTILIYHLGIDINKGLNEGDRERTAADPSWRDNYTGNVHLGLDAEKLWVAWQRGGAMKTDVYDGHWGLLGPDRRRPRRAARAVRRAAARPGDDRPRRRRGPPGRLRTAGDRAAAADLDRGDQRPPAGRPTPAQPTARPSDLPAGRGLSMTRKLREERRPSRPSRRLDEVESTTVRSCFLLPRSRLLELIAEAGRQPTVPGGGWRRAEHARCRQRRCVPRLHVVAPGVDYRRFDRLHVNTSDNGTELNEVMSILSGGDVRLVQRLDDA